ncbi:hypothetical protein ABZ035_29095, partial [Streptomyces sp. NPDC006334]
QVTGLVGRKRPVHRRREVIGHGDSSPRRPAAPSVEIARKAVEKSGITAHESFDGEFAAKVKTGPYEWTRMAGIQVGGPSNG